MPPKLHQKVPKSLFPPSLQEQSSAMVVCRIKPSFSVYIVCFRQTTREGCGCREFLAGQFFRQISTLLENSSPIFRQHEMLSLPRFGHFPVRKMAAGKSAPPSGTLLDFLLWDRHSLLEFFWFQEFEGIFECVVLTLPYKPPEGQNPCNWTPITPLRNASDTTPKFHPKLPKSLLPRCSQNNSVCSVWRIYSKCSGGPYARIAALWDKGKGRSERRIPKSLPAPVNIA